MSTGGAGGTATDSDPRSRPDDGDVDHEEAATDTSDRTLPPPADRRAVRLPAPGTVSERLPLLRALRALRTRVPGPPADELDERATVDRITEERLWEPVRAPTQLPAWNATVVIDAASSMRLWRARIGDAVRLLHHLGAFAGVRWAHLDTAGAVRWGAPPGLRLGLPAERRAAVHARPITLVLTDGLDARWLDGRAGAALAPLGARTPLALLHLLPYRLWPRTTLGRGAAPGILHRGRVEPEDEELPDAVGSAALLHVPVVDLEARALRDWSKMVRRGSGRWPVIAALPTTPQVLPPAPAPDAAARVARFRRSASPLAVRLATLLAQSAIVELPLARAVREACLPAAGFAEEVEVLLGGILEVRGQDPARPDAVELAMLPEARAALRLEVRRDDMPDLFGALARWLRDRPGVPPAMVDVLVDPAASAEVRLDPSDPLVAGLLDAMRLAGGRWGDVAEDAAPAFDEAEEEGWIAEASRWLRGEGEDPGHLTERQARAVWKRVAELGAHPWTAPGAELLLVRAARASPDHADRRWLRAWFQEPIPAPRGAERPTDARSPLLVREAVEALEAMAPESIPDAVTHVTRWLASGVHGGRRRLPGPHAEALDALRTWVRLHERRVEPPPTPVDPPGRSGPDLHHLSELAYAAASGGPEQLARLVAELHAVANPVPPSPWPLDILRAGSWNELQVAFRATHELPPDRQPDGWSGALLTIDHLLTSDAPQTEPRRLAKVADVGGRRTRSVDVWLRPRALLRERHFAERLRAPPRPLTARLDVLAPFPAGKSPAYAHSNATRWEFLGALTERAPSGRLCFALCPLGGAAGPRYAVDPRGTFHASEPASPHTFADALEAALTHLASRDLALAVLPEGTLAEGTAGNLVLGRLQREAQGLLWLAGTYGQERNAPVTRAELGVGTRRELRLQPKRGASVLAGPVVDELVLAGRLPAERAPATLVEARRTSTTLHVLDTVIGRLAVVFSADLDPTGGFTRAIRDAGVDLLFVLGPGFPDPDLFDRALAVLEMGCAVALVDAGFGTNRRGLAAFFGVPWHPRALPRWVRWDHGTTSVQTPTGSAGPDGRAITLLPGGHGLVVDLGAWLRDARGPAAP